MSKLNQCKIIDLPRFTDERGSLGVIEVGEHTPFEVKRIYYLFDVPDQAERGVHAHKKLQQLIVPICGSFDILLDDGTERKKFTLNNPTQGILITNMIWRELDNFSPGTVCMVFASEHYDDNDYYHIYEEFIADLGKHG
jgi:dTDP-4-dehydrorhamnose 3,5-epimerase-like enzyme